MQTNDILIPPAATRQATPQEEAEFLRKKAIPFLLQELAKARRKLADLPVVQLKE